MYLLDEWEGLLTEPEAPVFEMEYEIKARVNVHGVLDLPCARVRFWTLPLNKPTDAPQTLNLVTRTRREPVLGTVPSPPPRPAQYYVPGGMAEEIVVLLTLFTRVHFVLTRSTRMDGLPIVREIASHRVVGGSEKDGSTINLVDFSPRFELLRALKSREECDASGVPRRRRLEPFMLAARLYHLALGVKEHDEVIAYLNLVSAIEALLHDYEIGEMKLEDFDPALATLARETTTDEEQYERLATALVQRERFIGRKFRHFILDHLTKRFWVDDTRPKRFRFESPNQLEDYLRRIYQARSAAIHEGKPFPPTAFGEWHPEVPVGLGIQIGKKKWGEDELLPSFRAFERIVHHVLVEYLEREVKVSALK